MAYLEMFPAMDEIKQEVQTIHNVKVGDTTHSLARTSAASDKVDECFNKAITFHMNAGALFMATSAFFSRDNVALPGVALYFKILSQAEKNDEWLIIDFMSKRGARVDFGPTAAPPSDWCSSKDCSDVIVAFTKTLAIFKVQLKKANDAKMLACKEGDALAEVFLGTVMCGLSEKIRVVSHHLSHLKMVETDKHAIKEFDRRLPFELEDFAIAAGIEASIPARLQIGTTVRAFLKQTKQFDLESSDAATSMRQRAAFNQVL